MARPVLQLVHNGSQSEDETGWLWSKYHLAIFTPLTPFCTLGQLMQKAAKLSDQFVSFMEQMHASDIRGLSQVQSLRFCLKPFMKNRNVKVT